MTKKKSGNKSIFKSSGFYFVLLYLLLTIAFIVQILTVNLLPMKFLIPIIVIIILLSLGMYYLQMGRHINKINKVLGKILIIILSVLLGFGNWYLYSTGSAFSRMTTRKDISVVSIVVMKDSSIEKVNDLNEKKLGIMSVGDIETQDKAIADLKKDLGSEPTTVKYNSYKDFGDDLYEGKVDAILLNEGSRGMFEDNHSDFDQKTRVVKQYTYKSEAKDISKNVDVTKDPFNVYITGMDTFGTISTVSRSDVNMIVSINPKTHQILMTGIPRDFYVPQTCQGNQSDKLTHTGIYGVECTISSVENFMNTELNYYARVNFSSVVDIVNALGGITIESPFSFVTSTGVPINQGANNLNGEQTLAFVRERKNLPDGDRERSRNQMRAVEAMINKAISPSIITNYSSIMNAVSGSFQTNMSQKEMTDFIKQQLNDMKGWDIKQIQVSGSGANLYSPANGFNSYMMVPNEATVENAKKLIDKIDSGEIITDEDVAYQNQLVSKAG